MTTQPRTFGGRYVLGELIGYGGMAEVHRGRDLRLNRDVAVKVLRADLARDPSFLARFRREAHSAAGLNHPAIVAVYDTGEEVGADGTPQPYIVMEYVEGRTLRDILRSEGRLPARRALEITADVCSALDFSHRNGIVHRDIKPANVMITPAGAVKVMDFGIARAVADNSATVTQTANVIGTAQYLSPEQARGESVDARSDVYSTGCLLYELVTGAPPFQGDSPVAVAYQHVRENPVLPSTRNPEVPRSVDSIVMKALAKNTLNRYQSAAEMRQDIQRSLANQPVVAEAVMTDAERTQFIARTPPPPVAIPRHDDDYAAVEDHSRRNGLIWLAVVLALLLVIGAASWLIFKYRSDNGGGKDVAIPSDLVGQSAAAAQDELTRLNLTPVQEGQTSGACYQNRKVQKDQVCTIDPAPGTSVKEHSPVRFKLYEPLVKQVPNVVGEPKTQAENMLNQQGFKNLTIKTVDTADSPNQVISQDPAAYTSISPSHAIVLTVSTGKVKLPDVTGLTFDKAQQKLNKLGFVHITVPPPTTPTTDQSKNGEVASQSPTAGIAYALDTQITLTVFAYQAPSSSASSSASASASCSSSASSGPPGSPSPAPPGC
jgi:serine/threonine-protein kinase